MSESRSRLRVWLCALCACAAGGAWLGACTGGTDTGNPLTDLEIGNCKSDSGDDEDGLAATRSALRLDQRADGLTCFHARRGAEQIELTAHSFAGGCHVEWDAAGRARDGRVDIILTNPSCAVSGCGSCLYDASFAVELAALDPGRERADEIDFVDQPCEGDAEVLGTWQVPEREGDSTVACSFARGADWHAGRLGLFGKENWPCGANGAERYSDPELARSCENGLTCVEVSEHDRRCLRQCESKDDCAVPDAMRCEDGVCVL
jgi:hypothetical protein